MLQRIVTIFLRVIFLGILTTFIFLGLGSLTFKNAIAIVTKIEETPGEVLYRSQTRLDDQSGKVWQVVLFKQEYPNQAYTINLRLVGFPGSAQFIHPQPLKITSATGQVWNAADIFLDEAPAPTIGQYDLKDILPQLPPESVTLAIPLPGAKSINISVPVHVVKEWQSIITN